MNLRMITWLVQTIILATLMASCMSQPLHAKIVPACRLRTRAGGLHVAYFKGEHER